MRLPWGCKLFASFHIKDAYIDIGDNVAIGPEVMLLSAGHNHETYALTDTAGTIQVGSYFGNYPRKKLVNIYYYVKISNLM